MAFHDVVFPQLACKGITRSEDVIMETIGNGTTEARHTPVEWGRFTWNISSVGQHADVIRAANSFIRRRHYRVNSFKFKDPVYPELDEDVLGHYSGTRWKLYLSEYDETGNKVAGVHPIFHPDMSNLTIKRNGSPTSGTFSVIDGEPILTIPGSISTDTITVSGPYWLSVRLASVWSWTTVTLTDEGYTDVGPHAVRTGDIVLQEVFEY